MWKKKRYFTRLIITKLYFLFISISQWFQDYIIFMNFSHILHCTGFSTKRSHVQCMYQGCYSSSLFNFVKVPLSLDFDIIQHKWAQILLIFLGQFIFVLPTYVHLAANMVKNSSGLTIS